MQTLSLSLDADAAVGECKYWLLTTELLLCEFVVGACSVFLSGL